MTVVVTLTGETSQLRVSNAESGSERWMMTDLVGWFSQSLRTSVEERSNADGAHAPGQSFRSAKVMQLQGIMTTAAGSGFMYEYMNAITAVAGRGFDIQLRYQDDTYGIDQVMAVRVQGTIDPVPFAPTKARFTIPLVAIEPRKFSYETQVAVANLLGTQPVGAGLVFPLFATAGTIRVRLNLAEDPNGVLHKIDNNAWSGYYGPPFGWDDADTAIGGSSYVINSTANTSGAASNPEGMWVMGPCSTAAKRVTAQVRAKIPAGVAVTVAGRTSLGEGQSSYTYVGTGNWDVVAVTYDDSGSAYVGIQVVMARPNGTPARTLKFNGFSVEETPSAPVSGPASAVPTYIDGNQVGGTASYSWLNQDLSYGLSRALEGASAGLLDFGPMVPTGVTQMTNTGTADTYPVFTVSGGWIEGGFEIAQNGSDKLLRYVASLSDGETLTIDMSTKRVLGNSQNDLTNSLVAASNMRIGPGETVAYSIRALGASGGNPTLTVTTRNAWW